METQSTSMSRRSFITGTAATLATFGLMGTNTFGQTTDNFTTTLHNALFDATLDANGQYALPPLPYDYKALEPYIDAQTMELHHDKHFAAYMNGLNTASAKLQSARASGDYSTVSLLENDLAFNGAGYMLHTVFFKNMAPAGSAPASQILMDVLAKHFGSFDAFKAHFSAVAAAVQGSGWAILGYQPMGNRLVILQADKHQGNTQWNIIPILVLDVWEHAYYLKYQNKRKDYIDAWWNVINWRNVEDRIQQALSLLNSPTNHKVAIGKISSKFWC